MEKAKKVAATATDNSTTKEIAGTIAVGAGSSKVSLALGGAVATTSLGSKDKKQKVLAQINNSTLKTINESALNVQALNNSHLHSIAAGGAVTAGTGLIQVGAEGSVVKTTLYSLTEASLTGNTVEQNGGAADLTVLSQETGEILATADGLSVAGSFDKLTVDAMGAVSVLDSNVDTIASLTGGTYNVAQTQVTANSTQTITEVDAGVSVSMLGELTSISAAGSVAINKINNNTEANLTNTTIEAASLAALASSVEKIHSYGGALSVGASDKLGVSVGGTVVLNTIGGTTSATVSGSTIDTTGLLDVEAKAEHILDDISITGGVAGSTTAAIGVNAVVVLNTIEGATSATVTNSALNKKKTAGADAGQSVKVVANDKTTVESYILTVPVAGAGTFSLSATGSVDRNNFTRTTSAAITGKSSTEQSTVNADSLTVDATSEATATIQENGLGIAIATVGATAVGCVSVDNYANTTTAEIANITGYQENVSLNATSTKEIDSYTSEASLAGGTGAVGITASVVVVDDTAKTTATLEGSTLKKATERAGSVAVKATNTNKLISHLGNISLAAGLGGALGATVFVGTVNNAVASYVANSKVGAANSNNNYESFAAEATNNLTQDYSSLKASAGLASIGAGVNVANYTSGALANIAQSEIYAQSMNMAATENRTFEANMDEATLAGVTLGANVNLINVGTSLQKVYTDETESRATYDTSEIENKVKEAKQQAKDATNTLASKDYAQEVVTKDTQEVTFNRGGEAQGVVTTVEGSTLKATKDVKLSTSSANNIDSNIREYALGIFAAEVAVSNIDTVNKNSVVVKNSSVSADTISAESKESGTTTNLVQQIGFGALGAVNVQVTKVKHSGENTITFDKAQLIATSALTALAQDTTKITNEAKGIDASLFAGANVMVVRAVDKSNDLIYVQNASTLASYKETKAQEELKVEAGEGAQAEGKERTTYIKDANGKTLRTIVSEYVTDPSDASKKIRQDKIYDENGQDITSSEAGKLKTVGSDVYYCADYNKFTGGKVELTTENAVTTSTTAYAGVGAVGSNPSVLISTAQAGGDNTGRSEIIVTGENTFAGESVSLASRNKQSVTASQKAVTTAIMLSVGVMTDKAINEGTAKVKLAANQTVIADKLNLTAQALAPDKLANAEADAWTVTAGTIGVGVNLTTATTAMDVAVDVGSETYQNYSSQATQSVAVVEGSGSTQKITGVEYTLKHTAPQQGGIAVAVEASSGTTVKSYVTNVTAGAISTGTNSAESKDENKVTVNIASGENNAMGTLAINASNSDKAITYANGDGGGALSVSPYAAKAQHTNNTSTSVNLSGTYKLTGDFKVDVVNALTEEMTAKALQAAIAGYSGILAENTVTNAALLNLEGAIITTTGSVALGTENKVTFNSGDDYAVKGNNYGIANVEVLRLRNNITTTSTTNIGANTSITTEGGQSYWAKTDNTINSNLYLLGLAAAGIGVNVGSNTVNITANDKVELAQGASLRTSQGTNDVILAAVDNQNLHTGTKAETTWGGVLGASSAHSNNTLWRNNEVVVAGDILSYNDVKLLAGEDVSGALGTMYVKSEAEAFNKTLIPVCTSPQVNNAFNQHNDVNVTGTVRAIHDATIYADAGKESTDTFCSTYTIWAGKGGSKYVSTTNGKVTTEGEGDIPGKKSNNYFTVTGSVVAGLANKLNVTVGEKNSSGGYDKKIVVLDDTSYERLTDKTNVIILLSDEEYAKRKAAGTLKSNYPYRKYSEIIHVEDDEQKDIYDIVGLKASDFQAVVVDYALGNYQRLEELRLLMADYSETKSDNKNTAAYLGYEAEYNRIVKLLQDKKLINEKGELTGSMLINSLIVPDLVSSGGNIYIQTPKYNDPPNANGKLVAKGTPEIKLENYTSLATIVNDVTMKDAGGEIYHNSVRVYPTTGSAGAAGDITIIGYNDYTSVTYKDDNNAEKTEPLMADIYIQGTVTNLKGDVLIESKNNDIMLASDTTDASGNKVQGGSVSGKIVTLKADKGSIYQGFVDTIINTRTDPQLQYQELYQQFVSGHTTSSTDVDSVEKSTLKTYTPEDKSKATGGYITGGSVYISATDVNINGLVQSGFDYYYVDYDVDNTYVNSNGDIVASSTSGAQTLSAKMQEIEQKYAAVAVSDSNVLGNPNYLLTSGGSVYNATKGYYELEVATYYNPSTKKILVSNVDKTGGNIYITGQISSTGDGKLVCLDGTYDINVKVTDSKKHTVVTGQLLSNDTEGKITLKDTATNKTYVYTCENGKVYTTIYDLLETKEESKTSVAETEAVNFTPLTGLRYNWTTGNNTSTKNTYRKTWRNSW